MARYKQVIYGPIDHVTGSCSALCTLCYVSITSTKIVQGDQCIK